MKNIFLVFLTLPILTFFGCKKNPENKSAAQSITRPAVKKTSSGFKQVQNPFDYIGEAHNQSVQAVWDYVQQTGDTTRKGKQTFFIRYFTKAHGIDPTKSILACEPMKKQSVEALLEKSTFSAESRVLLQSIKDTGSSLDDEASYAVFKDKISRIELQATQEIKNESERNVVLQVAVIAKYSAAYWKQKLTDFGTTAPGKWWVFASADIIGGIMGGIFGGGVLEMASEMSSGMNWYADHYWG